MADFPFLSDSEDEKAVNDLLSQAADHSLLEQIAAINCSGFGDSSLPPNLEARFRKLKSFPATKPSSSSPGAVTGKKPRASSSFNSQLHTVESRNPKPENPSSKGSAGATSLPDSSFDEKIDGLSSSNEKSGKKTSSEPKPRHGVSLSPSNSSVGSGTFSPSKRIPDWGLLDLKSESKSAPISSPSNYWDSVTEPPSPPKKTGCFWCSPKKDSEKKSKDSRIAGIGLDWEKDDLFLSELNAFTTKEQQRRLKKVLKEEEKICREAEKIVEWAKQASARMDASEIIDDLSDNDGTK